MGIKQVKEKTDQLMTLLNSVWEAENDLQIPPNIPLLNQAFVGRKCTLAWSVIGIVIRCDSILILSIIYLNR